VRDGTRLRVLLLLLPPLGAAGGFLAGPFLARANLAVRTSAAVRAADVPGAGPAGLEVEAFRASARPAAELHAEASRVARRFRTGGAWFGLWCGLAAAAQLLAARPRRRKIYEIDPAACVSCARCFMSCPRERARRKGGR